MANPTITKEEAVNQLYSTIKTKFEQEGVLQELRCMLQTKMVAMMKGEKTSMVPRPFNSGNADTQRDSRLMVLNQLIMEYFHWHQFRYSAEMFSMESSTDNTPPMRECLEGTLGHFDQKDVPILLNLVAELMEKEIHNA